MLSTNLTLDDSSGDELTWNLQAYLPDGARRIDSASTLTEPRFLEIKHSNSGKGAGIVDRHLVSASKQKLDGAGVPYKAIANFTMAVPRNTVFSTADVLDLAAAIIDLITDGGFSGSGFAGTTNASAILRGES
uniref:Uncharacterized protein n=1 Tax=Leviviridae sp. TaxID=2027243 RepID=A0A514D536_9VIRU|nr:MAG: hypothetical protein H2Bulk35506_000002 [Leviviridae sp.]